MFPNIIAIIQHRHSTKLFSLILGYSLWFCMAQYQTITKTIQAPLYFYDTNHQQCSSINAVELVLQGSRSDIYHFNPAHGAIHLDGSNLHPGENELTLSKENLFLPDSLKLVDLVPSHITIHVNSIEKT